MTILSDHENGPDAICRHLGDGDPDGTKTVFWCLADVTGRQIRYGHGNPCRSQAQSYTFPPGG